LGVEINPSFPEDLFDIEKKRMSKSTKNPEQTDAKDENDIEKTIEEFNRIYE